jgi:hypothetical protein
MGQVAWARGVLMLVSVSLSAGFPVSPHAHHPKVDKCSQLSKTVGDAAQTHGKEGEGGNAVSAFSHLAHVNDNGESVESRILAASAWVFESGVVMMRRSLQYDDAHRETISLAH